MYWCSFGDRYFGPLVVSNSTTQRKDPKLWKYLWDQGNRGGQGEEKK